jgi:hypothetical protein
MPIIGLTDRAATLPQIGTIRKGAAKPETGNRPGADLKHFRFDSDDAEATAAFARAYGPEPVAIHAYLPFDSTDENFDAWKEEWVGGGLRHRCDGQMTAICLLPNGTYTTEPRPCPGGCKQVGRLKVIVPELRRLAFVTVMTTSIHDIMNIHANLEALYNTRRSLKGIPLIVRRVPREISTPDKDGKRVRREKWLIHVEAQPQWVELQLQAAADAALPISSGRQVITALPAWDGDDDDDAIDPTVPPLPPMADKEAEKRLEIQAKNLALTLHKGDKATAAQFYAAHLDAPTFAQRQELYLALSSHDGLIQVVEQRLNALVEAGFTHDQIQKVLDGIGYGTAFDDMSDAQLITLSGEIYHETKGGKK